MRRDGERSFRSDEDAAGEPGDALFQVGGARLVGDRHEIGRVSPHLRRQHLHVAAGRERDGAEAVREALDQRQRRDADRPGRAEEREGAAR